MSYAVVFAREPIKGRSGTDIESYEIAEGLFTASIALPKTGSLELMVGETPLALARQLYRRVSLRGGILGRGSSGTLYSSEAILLVRTGIADEVKREISVRLGTDCEHSFEVQTDASGEAEIRLSDIFLAFEPLGESGPQALRVELLRPRESEGAAVVGSGVRMRADVWPEFQGRRGVQLMCSQPPQNLVLNESRNIFVDNSQIPCIDADATSEAEIVFEIEGKLRRYSLPPLDLNIVHVMPDGTVKPMPIGTSLVLSLAARGGALRIRSNDDDVELEIPGRPRFKPFRGGRSSTVGLRTLGSGWIRLHRRDGLSINLAELREEFCFRTVAIMRRHGSVQIKLSLEGEIDALRAEVESELGEVEIGDVHFGPDRFMVRPPDWVASTPPADGSFDVSIDGRALASGTWLARLYVRDKAGWHSIVSARGDLLTFITAHGEPEPERIRTAERTKRVLGWLDICQALESWKEGGVGAALCNRKSALLRHLDALPGGRTRIIEMSLNDDWFVAGSTWMPPMQALFDCPEMFEGSITNCHNAGGAYEAFALLESRRLRDLDFIDPAAFFGFANAARAESTSEKLKGFDFKRLMQVVSSGEGFAELRWNGRPVLGATHWRSAHLLLQDRIEETRFFGEDPEGNNGNRSLNLRRLHGVVGRSGSKPPVPGFLSGAHKTIHEDCSQTLRAFAGAARSRETLSWISALESHSDLSRKAILGSLGDLVRLASELFAFHLIAAELERRN